MKNNTGLLDYLTSFLTENRKKRIDEVLTRRTRYLTVVLEDLFQPHNASAVLRSCDGFGIQDVHIIENRNQFKPNKEIDMGTAQWLNIQKYRPDGNNSSCTKETLKGLKDRGYKIIATTPHTNNIELENIKLEEGRLAIVFGTELEGITQDVIDIADEFVKIPMYGFVESFNISVACAISLHHLSWRLRNSDINWQLSEKEREEIKLEWLRKTVKNANELEKHYYNL